MTIPDPNRFFHVANMPKLLARSIFFTPSGLLMLLVKHPGFWIETTVDMHAWLCMSKWASRPVIAHAPSSMPLAPHVVLLHSLNSFIEDLPAIFGEQIDEIATSHMSH